MRQLVSLGKRNLACSTTHYSPATQPARPSDAGKKSASDYESCDDCEVGSYSITGSSACELCGKGEYASSTASTSCARCPAGKHVNETGADACDSCETGTYASSSGADVCIQCSVGTVAASEGASACSDCGELLAPAIWQTERPPPSSRSTSHSERHLPRVDRNDGVRRLSGGNGGRI